MESHVCMQTCVYIHTHTFALNVRTHTRNNRANKHTTSLFVVTNLNSRCLTQCYGFMNTSPLYFHFPFFCSGACLTIPLFSPLPHSFSPSFLSLALSAWFALTEFHHSSFIHATADQELIPFTSFFFVCFFCVNPISRMFPAYRTLVRHRTAFCKVSYTKVGKKNRENYDMREANRGITV